MHAKFKRSRARATGRRRTRSPASFQPSAIIPQRVVQTSPPRTTITRRWTRRPVAIPATATLVITPPAQAVPGDPARPTPKATWGPTPVTPPTATAPCTQPGTPGQMYPQSGAVTYTPTGSTTPTTQGYSLTQQGTSRFTTNGTATFTLTGAGYTTYARITQTGKTASTTIGTDAGVLTTPNTGGGSDTVFYTSRQNSGDTGSSTTVTDISQSGQTVTTSGTFVMAEDGSDSDDYSASDTYSSGTSSADMTYGTDVYSQTGDDSYSIGTQGQFSGMRPRELIVAQSSTYGWDDTTTETGITPGSTNGNATNYSVTSGGSNAAQSQLSESFVPAGATGSFKTSQTASHSISQNDTELYTDSGSMMVLLPGGDYPVTTADSGESTYSGGGSSSYAYEITGTFTPTSSSGTDAYTEQGGQAYQQTDSGVETGSGLWSTLSDGYKDSQYKSTGLLATKTPALTRSLEARGERAFFQISSSSRPRRARNRLRPQPELGNGREHYLRMGRLSLSSQISARPPIRRSHQHRFCRKHGKRRQQRAH